MQGALGETANSAVRLSAGSLMLELVPELGGCVSRFTHDGTDLMRPLRVSSGATPHALHSGMFPMVPFANSLRDNGFELDGRRYQVAPNMEGARLNYHGSGWLRPWRAAAADAVSCRLVLEAAEEAPGYLFAAEQRFALSSGGLELELSVTNRSPRRMPFGFGLHPWFPRHSLARATFSAQQVVLEDAGFQATGLSPIPEAQDFAGGLEPPHAYQNRCYAGWNGVAHIAWPTLGLGLTIEAGPVFEHLMFHVPAHDHDTFCLEPQSNRTSAFDGVGTDAAAPGIRLLEPGETLSGHVAFIVDVSA